MKPIKVCTVLCPQVYYTRTILPEINFLPNTDSSCASFYDHELSFTA